MESTKKSSAVKWLILVGPVVTAALFIIIPLMGRLKQGSARDACIANLKQIQGASISWGLESKMKPADPVDLARVSVFLKGGVLPKCPAGGTYSVTIVSEAPRCSIVGHTLDP